MQNVLVLVGFLFVLHYFLSFSLDLRQFLLVLLSDHLSLLLQCVSKLGSVLDFATTYQHLGIHRFYFVL